MNFFFDENFSETVPAALDTLEATNGQHKIYSTKVKFAPGLKDQNLIPKIAKFNGVLVTFDRKALKAHIKLLKRKKVSAIAFSCADKNYDAKIDLILRSWIKIKELVEEKISEGKIPFYFKVSHNGIKEWK